MLSASSCVSACYLGCLRGAGDVNRTRFHSVCFRPLVEREAAFAPAPVPVGQRAIVPAHTQTHTLFSGTVLYNTGSKKHGGLDSAGPLLMFPENVLRARVHVAAEKHADITEPG